MNEWRKEKLSNLIELKYGKDHKNLKEGSFPCYGTGGIIRFVNTYLYNQESILIPRKGSLKNLYYINSPFWTVDTLFWTKISTELVIPKFLYYKLKTINLNHLDEGSVIPSLTAKSLNKINILIPYLKIQKKIAKILSDIDEKIELNNKINDNLEKQLQILFKKMFENKINNINKNNSKPLKEFVEVIDNRGKTPPQSSIKTNFPIIDVKSLAGDTRIIDYNNCSKYVDNEIFNNWFRSGHPLKYDILISTVGSLAELKLFFENKGCIAQNVVSFRSKKISALYLYQYLKYIKNDLISYNIGSVQPSIKITHIINYQIFYSDFEEINKFHNLAIKVTDKIFYNCKEIETLNKIKNYLLPKLMNEEINVENIEL